MRIYMYDWLAPLDYWQSLVWTFASGVTYKCHIAGFTYIIKPISVWMRHSYRSEDLFVDIVDANIELSLNHYSLYELTNKDRFSQEYWVHWITDRYNELTTKDYYSQEYWVHWITVHCTSWPLRAATVRNIEFTESLFTVGIGH